MDPVVASLDAYRDRLRERRRDRATEEAELCAAHETRAAADRASKVRATRPAPDDDQSEEWRGVRTVARLVGEADARVDGALRHLGEAVDARDSSRAALLRGYPWLDDDQAETARALEWKASAAKQSQRAVRSSAYEARAGFAALCGATAGRDALRRRLLHEIRAQRARAVLSRVPLAAWRKALLGASRARRCVDDAARQDENAQHTSNVPHTPRTPRAGSREEEPPPPPPPPHTPQTPSAASESGSLEQTRRQRGGDDNDCATTTPTHADAAPTANAAPSQENQADSALRVKDEQSRLAADLVNAALRDALANAALAAAADAAADAAAADAAAADAAAADALADAARTAAALAVQRLARCRAAASLATRLRVAADKARSVAADEVRSVAAALSVADEPRRLVPQRPKLRRTDSSTFRRL